MKQLVTATALLLLAACSPEPGETPQDASNEVTPVEATENASPPAPTPAPTATAAAVERDVLTLEGLGDLRIGQPVPENSDWAARGAQVPGGCTTVSTPDYPGVYAIVSDGAVRRITVGQRSDVTLIEGIGVGASEAEVRAAFPGFRETPHKYVEAPAKYLTAPNAESGDAALRFEIDRDGKVSLIHVGTMPVLGYVEGCA